MIAANVFIKAVKFHFNYAPVHEWSVIMDDKWMTNLHALNLVSVCFLLGSEDRNGVAKINPQ